MSPEDVTHLEIMAKAVCGWTAYDYGIALWASRKHVNCDGCLSVIAIAEANRLAFKTGDHKSTRRFMRDIRRILRAK